MFKPCNFSCDAERVGVMSIRNLRSNVSDAQRNRGWVTLGPNLGVFPLEQTRHDGVAKSEHPRLTNGEIIFEEFQPM